MKSEYKRVVTQASAEMLARWILKNLDWSGGNDDANGAFLTSILLEHRRQAQAAVPEAVLTDEPVAWISEHGLELLKDHLGDPKARVAHAQYAIYTIPLYRRRPSATGSSEDK